MERQNIQSQHKLETAIYDAIQNHYDNAGGTLPETVLVAIDCKSLDVKVVDSYDEAIRDPETRNWNVEEIPSDNLSDNISEAASWYFDTRLAQ